MLPDSPGVSTVALGSTRGDGEATRQARQC
jgi:hypothetical protein